MTTWPDVVAIAINVIGLVAILWLITRTSKGD